MSLLVKTPNGPLATALSKFWETENMHFPDLFNLDHQMKSWDLGVNVPFANIVENENDYLIEIAAPGKKREDIKVEVENNTLTISSETRTERETNAKNYRRQEFSYDYFTRSFQLPQNSNPDKISAKYEDGILSITLPKKEATPKTPRKEVKVS